MKLLFESILSGSATIISMASGYGAYNKYLIEKDKYIKASISDSVEYSYLTYVKPQKQNIWSTEQKQIAKKYAIDYFNDDCIYKINNIRLNRLIEARLFEIKASKLKHQI